MNKKIDYTTATHWERLDKIIRTLIYKDEVHNDTDFYYQLDLDISSASLIRTGKRKLPKKARYRMFALFDINEAFLMEGKMPLFTYGNPEHELDEVAEDLVYLRAKVKKQEAVIKEMRKVLQDAIKFGKLDLKNKGLLEEE